MFNIKNVSLDSAISYFIIQNFVYWLIYRLNPIFAIASERRLEQDDMFDIYDDERSKNLGDKLERYKRSSVQAVVS
jgi:hypothetical protein